MNWTHTRYTSTNGRFNIERVEIISGSRNGHMFWIVIDKYQPNGFGGHQIVAECQTRKEAMNACSLTTNGGKP